jgi:hypothetical protein
MAWNDPIFSGTSIRIPDRFSALKKPNDSYGEKLFYPFNLRSRISPTNAGLALPLDNFMT